MGAGGGDAWRGFAGVDFDAVGADPFVEDGCKISDCV